MTTGTKHVFEFLAEPLSEVPGGVCAVFGGERFLKKLAVSHLVRCAGKEDPDFAASHFDSDSARWTDIHDELATRTLFGGDGPRIVVVDHADGFVKENRERLEDYQASGGTGLLVLIVDSWASNTRLYKAINKSGMQIKCDPPTASARSRQRDEKQVQDWLIRAYGGIRFQFAGGRRSAID